MTIVKRGDSYGVRVYDSATKRKRWVGTFPTRRAAREAERDAMRHTVPAAYAATQEDCAAYAARWLETHQRKRPAASTRRNYRYALRPFIDDFRGVPIGAVKHRAALEWSEAHPVSNSRAVRAMFSDAIHEGAHPGPNPFARLGLEQPRGRKDLVALTESEVSALADVALETCGAYGSQFRAMMLFAAYVGLRPAELFALERSDIHRDEVVIRQAVGGDNEVKKPKNGRERIVILPPAAREALRELVIWPDVPWLFVTPRGLRFSKNSHYYYWRPVKAAFGRPEMDFYELRHFCATHLLELGVSHADVAVQLGHTDGGRLVMETYGHPTETGARERLKQAYGMNVGRIDPARGSRHGRKAV
jgi:integrase